MRYKRGNEPTMEPFKGRGQPLLIGSLPLHDHREALKWVFSHTPEIPLWVQLPAYREEGMLRQFLPGFPGLVIKDDKTYIDTTGPEFEADLLNFFEVYLDIIEGRTGLAETRFALGLDTAKGFFALVEQLSKTSPLPRALKGQVTGPITFATGIRDQKGRAIFYDEQLRDIAVKQLALKARWQIQALSRFERPVIIFIDEPALAGFGSSEFISISQAEITSCLEEVIEAIHTEGAMAGIHVCANTDWAMILESSVDIVNFDAYAYFDKFILYRDQIVRFIESGRNIAWGIVPTLNADDVEKETAASLYDNLSLKLHQIAAFGIDQTRIIEQALITPCCGAGTLSLDLAQKVLSMTREVSQRIRDIS